MADIVIVSAARTAVGKFLGSIAQVRAPGLGAIATPGRSQPCWD
jgi:acetyl-CoA acetyltransferase